MGSSDVSVSGASSRKPTSTRGSSSADGPPAGAVSEHPPVSSAAHIIKNGNFFITVRFSVLQPVEIRFDTSSDRNVDDPVAAQSHPVDRIAVRSHRKSRAGLGRRKGERYLTLLETCRGVGVRVAVAADGRRVVCLLYTSPSPRDRG